MTNTAAPLESFGKIFQGDFIERNGMSLLQLTDDDAERFGRVFGVSGEYFKNLYAQYTK